MIKTILILLITCLLLGCADTSEESLDGVHSSIEETEEQNPENEVSPTAVLVGVIIIVVVVISYIIGYIKHAHHEIMFWRTHRKEYDDG